MRGCRQSQFDACRKKTKIMRIVNKLIGFSRGRRVNEVEVAGVMVGVHSAFRNKSLFCMGGFRIQLELSVFSQRRLREWNLVCSNLQDKKT